MKERPILFSTPMVQAILDGRKTQTRRVIKPQPELIGFNGNPAMTYCPSTGQTWNAKNGKFSLDGVHWIFSIPGMSTGSWKCPFGSPGDRLWVRESGWISKSGNVFTPSLGNAPALEKSDFFFKRIPSIFMPRWASRIALEITDIRVERVQEITWEDARDEGVIAERGRTLVSLYKDLWDSINARRGFGWDVNPWVWVIEFKRLAA